MTTTTGYRAIADHYRREILAGRLSPGDRLPTYAEAQRQWGTSVTTVSRAYRLMRDEGLTTGTTGTGTVVAPTAPIAIASGGDRADLRRDGGGNAGPGETLTGHEAMVWRCTDAAIARRLQISIGDRVVVRRRQRRGQDGRVNWFNTGYTVYRVSEIVPEILEPRPLGGTWPDLYHERCGQRVTRGPQQYGARLATADELHGLEIDAHGWAVPVLVKQTLWSDPDGPVDLWDDVLAPGLWDAERQR